MGAANRPQHGHRRAAPSARPGHRSARPAQSTDRSDLAPGRLSGPPGRSRAALGRARRDQPPSWCPGGRGHELTSEIADAPTCRYLRSRTRLQPRRRVAGRRPRRGGHMSTHRTPATSSRPTPTRDAELDRGAGSKGRAARRPLRSSPPPSDIRSGSQSGVPAAHRAGPLREPRSTCWVWGGPSSCSPARTPPVPTGPGAPGRQAGTSTRGPRPPHEQRDLGAGRRAAAAPRARGPASSAPPGRPGPVWSRCAAPPVPSGRPCLWSFTAVGWSSPSALGHRGHGLRVRRSDSCPTCCSPQMVTAGHAVAISAVVAVVGRRPVGRVGTRQENLERSARSRSW